MIELDLTCNRISKECLEKLMSGLRKNSTLEVLRVSKLTQGGHSDCSYIRRLGPFFQFKILNFNILGFSEKKYFLGHEDFLILFWDHCKTGQVLVVISMQFMVFS